MNSPTASPTVQLEPVSFYKDREGRVHLRGLYECPASNSVAFQLPPGYRPANNKLDIQPHSCSGGTCGTGNTGNLVIIGAGTGAIAGGGADGAVISPGDEASLDGVSFRAGG